MLVSSGALALSFVLGMGVTLIGLLLVLVGSTRGDPASGETWLGFAALAFGLTIYVEVSMIYNRWRERRRSGAELFGASTIILCGAASLALVERLAPDDAVPSALMPVIVVAVVLAVVLVVVNAVSKPPGRRSSSRKPPRRGPRNSMTAHHHEKTRGRVLDILLERRLMRLDDTERQRILEMPLG